MEVMVDTHPTTANLNNFLATVRFMFTRPLPMSSLSVLSATFHYPTLEWQHSFMGLIHL